MASKLRKKFSLRKSTPDLSEWGKNDAKLIEALNKGDTHKINSILTKKGINPTKLDPAGQTVFHRAATENKVTALQIFINHKADVNCRDINDKTPLHCACSKGHVECMKTLLRAGASPLSEDRDKQTPLHYAAGGGHQEAVKLFMRIQDAPLNAANTGGQTPIFLASQGGHKGVCEELIHNGAQVDHQDINHRTPLMLACEKGHSPIADLFVHSGANLILQDKKGHNAMWYAANAGKSNIEAYLRSVPHNPEWENRVSGQVPQPSGNKPLVQQKSSDSSHVGGVVNGHYSSSSSVDVNTAMVPLSDEDSSDDERGYVVPIDEHPATTTKRLKPPFISNAGEFTPQKRAPPDRFDEDAKKKKVPTATLR